MHKLCGVGSQGITEAGRTGVRLVESTDLVPATWEGGAHNIGTVVSVPGGSCLNPCHSSSGLETSQLSSSLCPALEPRASECVSEGVHARALESST